MPATQSDMLPLSSRAAPHPPAVGDEYRVIRPLGSAQERAFLAHDRKLDRAVVLHLLPASPDEQRSLLASAQALARVVHVSLCRVDRIREGGAAPCVVQTFERGERLSAVSGPLPAPQVRSIGAALAGALTALHAVGVAHGDVRADRIVLSPAGVPCLIGLRSVRAHAGQDAMAADIRGLGAVLVALADDDLAVSLRRFLSTQGEAVSAEALRRELEGGAHPPDGREEVDPYRGLRPFEVEHAGIFFGRDEEIAAAIGRLRGEPWLVVTAPSGAGKSSLVRAGIVPAIRAGALGERRHWEAAIVVPGPRPLEALSAALAQPLGRAPAAMQRELRAEPAFAARLAAERPAGDGGLVLVVDQLEEVMTLAEPAEMRVFFAAIAAFSALAPGVRAVFTLRTDFLDRLGTIEPSPLAHGLLRATFVLPPMGEEALRQAIVGPARARGFDFEAQSIVDQLVADGRTHAGGDALPLLSFLLTELWAERDRARRLLTGPALARLGGAGAAIARHGDTVLSLLSADERRAAQRILLALVTSSDTRARRSRDELVAGGGAAAERALEALVRGRIVVAGEGYEISHEALVRAWPKLRGWLDDVSDERAAARRLAEAAAEWERLGRDPALLWGARHARDLDRLGPGGGGEAAQPFAEASRRAIRRARRLRLGIALGVLLSLALSGAVVWGVGYARKRAAVAAAVARARRLGGEAEESARAAADARARALTAFDKDDLGPAERLWKESLDREEDAEKLRREVIEAAGGALALAPRDAAARALAADATLERLLAAERLHKKTLLGALAAELSIYDDGSRRDRLRAPGYVTARTDPPGAALFLARYREDDAGRLVEAEATRLAPDERHALEPGSYLVRAEAPGRHPTRYPFLVRRGEESTLRIVLPPAADVPEGMIYVPAGRTLYGSGDDEATRSFLEHQPRHDVEVGAFLIARTEVTNAEYLAFLGALPDADRKERLPWGLTALADGRIGWKFRDQVLAPGEPYCSGVEPCVDWSRLPVMGTTRVDGALFSQWLAREGRLSGARLCTDREWERAARGADDRRFPDGNADPGPTDACTLATYGGDLQRAGPCAAGTHPASRSPFGVEDLAGSEWEWTAGAADAAHGTKGIIRGGGWANLTVLLSISNRAVLGIGRRSREYGLRVCADVPHER